MTSQDTFPAIVELNVGGQLYTTALSTLIKVPDSLLGLMFTGDSKTSLLRDTRGRYFVDRDGQLFRYILDYLRNMRLVLPDDFQEKERLREEAEFYKLPGLIKSVQESQCNSLANSDGKSQDENVKRGYITLGYRGTFAFGRDGLADIQFRKLNRVLICGRVNLCREVFKDTLNESRDPDRGQYDRYTSRYFLKHTFLEQAFDSLFRHGFKLMTCCASGVSNMPGQSDVENEESRWNHYNEFIFFREA